MRPAIWLFLFVIAGPALAEPHIEQNAKGQAVKISRLHQGEQGEACHSATFEGRIVQREFSDDGLNIQGLIVEFHDGARSAYSVLTPRHMNLFWQHRIHSALQRLTTVGRLAKGKVSRCGSPEISAILDEIE